MFFTENLKDGSLTCGWGRFFCHKSKKTGCIKERFVCDGQWQCEFGEDEDLNLCKSRGIFSKGPFIYYISLVRRDGG